MDAPRLIAALGQDTGTPLSLSAAGTVALQFDSGVTLHLEHDAQQDVLHCYAVLGQEPADADQRSRLHAALLSANAFGRDTGGATLGVDDATSEVILSRRLELGHAEPAMLRDCVASLASVALAWRERLRGAMPGGTPARAAMPEATGSESMRSATFGQFA